MEDSTLKVPARMVRELRNGLHSLLGQAAQDISVITDRRGRERCPEWYREPLRCFDRSRALLDLLGWGDPCRPADVMIDAREHGWALVKRKGRPTIRPRNEWVWSVTPTHEPIVSRELFEIVEERSLSKRKATKAAAMVREQKSPDRPSTGRFYMLRGRVRCGMCGHRMEGSHQKGSNWYRCQYVRRRSQAAAVHADHPQVLGIKEAKVLEAVLDFLARRVFGPDRLRLLRDELADATASTWEGHAADLERLESELRDIERSLRVQALRLEEHEDPKHPVVALATERVEELSARKSAVAARLEALKAKRPAGHHPDEIAAMLDAVPDLRKALHTVAFHFPGEIVQV